MATRWCSRSQPRSLPAISATRGDEALSLFERAEPELVIIDTHIQPQGGFELLAQMRAIDPTACVLLVSQFGTHG